MQFDKPVQVGNFGVLIASPSYFESDKLKDCLSQFDMLMPAFDLMPAARSQPAAKMVAMVLVACLLGCDDGANLGPTSTPAASVTPSPTPNIAPATVRVQAFKTRALGVGRRLTLRPIVQPLNKADDVQFEWFQVEGPIALVSEQEDGGLEVVAPAVAQTTELVFQLSASRPGEEAVNTTARLIVHPVPRNVLMIITEDHGAQLGLLGTPGLSTPRIDALASGGSYFSDAFITLGTCTGAKSSLLTGLSNAYTGAVANVQDYIGTAAELAAENPPWFSDPNSAYNMFSIREDAPTLVEILHEAGYYSGLQNKLHIAPHTKFPFDEWYPGRSRSGPQVREFLTNAGATGQPWFLQHVIINPHRPFPDSEAGSIDVDLNAVSVPGHFPDTEVTRRDWAEYLQAIQDADARVGEVIDALEESGQASDTLIVFLGDHGPAYHRGKYSGYDLGLRIPLAFVGAGIPQGVRSDLFSGLDFTPTLLEILGLPPLPLSHGVSHYDSLYGAGGEPPRRYVVGVARSDRSISDGEYRLIFMPNKNDTFVPEDNRFFDRWRNRVFEYIVENKNQPGFAQAYRFLDLTMSGLHEFERPRFELFRTANDPWELNDLAADPAHAEALGRMKQALADMLDATADPGPRP